MAQVHKAHKGSNKYNFQRSRKKTLGWVIAIVVIVAAIIIGSVVYNNSTTGTIQVNAPAETSLNHIADNWQVLASHTDKFQSAAGENDSATLYYMGSEAADVVYIYIKPDQTSGEISNSGMFAKYNLFSADLGKLFSGEISLKNGNIALQAGNENCVIYLEKYNTPVLDDSALNQVIAELEAIIAEGPVVTEAPNGEVAEAPADEAAETPAE